MDMVEWVEPYDSDADTTLICRMSVEDAIKTQCKSGLSHGYAYTFDEDALSDFMAIHWAYRVTGKE